MQQTHWSIGALAACLFVFETSAAAQSSVTLYGLVDVVVDISNQGKGTQVAMQGGGLNSSQFGLRGTEDLGNGYKAIFDIEDGFNAGNGTLLQNGALFGRQAWVGLSGPWGQLTLGRQYSPEYVANAANDAFVHGLAGGLSNIGMTAGGRTAGLLPAYSTTGRTNNAINVISPEFHGLTVRAMYGFSNGAETPDGASLGGGIHLGVGPAAIDAGYIRSRPKNATEAVSALNIGGSVKFGRARVMAAYSNDISAASPGVTSRYALENLGVQYGIDASDRLLGQLVRIVDHSDGRPEADAGYVVALGIVHQLSKHTAVYCDIAQVWNRGGSAYSLGGAIYTGAPATPNAIGRNLQLGLQTAF